MLAFKKRIILEYLLMARAMAKEIEEVGDPHPLAADARLAAAFSRLEGNALKQCHIRTLPQEAGRSGLR
jgi:hypothetical protein